MKPLELLELAREKKINPDDFLTHLWSISKGTIRTGRRYTGSTKDPVRLFRSRIFKSKPLPSELSEYSYPPVGVTTIGRANRINSPIFYASAGGPTTFVEARAQKGDILAVSEFRCHSEIMLQEIGFIRNESSHSELEKSMHELFTQDGDGLYEYSSCIAHHLMGGEQIHGLTYPSIISNNSSQNVALKPSFVDEHMHLAHVTAYFIKNVRDSSKYDVEEVDFALPENGGLHWKGRKKQWVLRKTDEELKMQSNGWWLDAYDLDGTLVNPE